MKRLSVLLISLLLGIKHVAEADPLAAAATLVVRQTSSLMLAMQQGVAIGGARVIAGQSTGAANKS